MERKFKIGDKVIGNELASKEYTITNSDYIGIVTDVLPADDMYPVFGKNLIELDNKYLVKESHFNLYKPQHEGKILIIVDEKDENKIIARDLITGKKAEAKCNPKDEWDFNKGAQLAYDRLMEPEKLKGWTGKVIYTGPYDTYYFKVGKVYKVENGILYDNTTRPWYGYRFYSLKELNATVLPFGSFIEYKGGADK